MKKFLICLISLIFVVCTLGLIACGGGDQPPHTHVEASFGSDDTHHFSVCECGETFNKKEHDYSSSDFDALYHWAVCSCGKEHSKGEHQIRGAANVCSTCQTTIISDADALWYALDSVSSFSMHLSLSNDIDLADYDWQPITIMDGNKVSCEIDGRGHSIINMNQSLFAETYNIIFKVRNLTFKDANVESHTVSDGTACASLFSSEMLRQGVGCNYTFENVHVVDCNITSAKYGAAFVSYSNGGTVKVDKCSFKGTITGDGSVGVAVGHTNGNLYVNGLEVKEGSVIKNTIDLASEPRKAGAVLGTAAHSHDTLSGVQTVDVKNVTNKGQVVNINGVPNAQAGDLVGRIVQPSHDSDGCLTNGCQIFYIGDQIIIN